MYYQQPQLSMVQKKISINDPSLPKFIRKQAKLVSELVEKGKIEKLRALRDKAGRIKINIYHHSAGTDSYYDDIEGKYYSWAEVETIANIIIERGEHLSTVVIPYKSGVVFYKSSLQPNPSLN